MTHSIIRAATATLFVPYMKVSGFRFSKDYRHEVTPWKGFVYRNLDTVGANFVAWGYGIKTLWKYIW